MTQVRLPIGYDDFRKIIEKNLTLVDKSLFIKELLDDTQTEVSVITRPRRFGKTLNLSMLRYFLAAEVDGQPTRGLFDTCKIATAGDRYLQHQGQYPVIFITFKDIKKLSFQEALQDFNNTIQDLYRGYQYLLDSTNLTTIEKKIITTIINGDATASDLEISLKRLSELLYKHHGKKVFILIDEYDTPIQASYVSNYYDVMINFMRGLLGTALKTNSYLERAVITGVIRVAKESLFSGLNNVKLYSVLHQKYSEYFGFTEDEVISLLQQAQMTDKAATIREWYNGYQFGNTTVYNPWSIINCIVENKISPYWVNTSDNALIKQQIVNSSSDFKEQIEALLRGEAIEALIDEHVVFGNLKNDPAALWSLLVTTGYLKVVATRETERENLMCDVQIPNREIRTIYRSMIEQWLANGQGIAWYDKFLNNLLAGEVKLFTEKLTQIVKQTISFHDTAREPEAFYHGLMLGFTASLDRKLYEIKSNRESGLGRYDIMIIPKDANKLGIIFELKAIKAPKRGAPEYTEDELEIMLQNEAKAALEQIAAKNYVTELQQRGIQKTLAIGIAFYGKEFVVLHAFS